MLPDTNTSTELGESTESFNRSSTTDLMNSTVSFASPNSARMLASKQARLSLMMITSFAVELLHTSELANR